MKINSNKPSIILVLGMHRSGTSLVAQMVALWGAYMGEKLCDADFNNENGYWEFEKLNALNERILNALNASWMLPPKEINTKQLIDRFGKEAESLIDEMDLGGNNVWCWKDPRMAVLFNFWEKIFNTRKLIKVLAFRHPLSVARSLQKRDNLPTSFSLLLWEQYTQNIFNIIGDDECCFLEYEKIVSNPEDSGKKLFYFLNHATGITRSNDVCENMINSVKPQLNHSIPQSQVIDNPNLASIYLSLKKEEKRPKTQPLEQEDNWYKNELSNLFREKLSLENNVQHYAQLYIETTKAPYNEKDSIKKLVNTEIHLLDFDVSHYVDISALRIDPINDWCEVEIYGLRILREGKILFQPENFFTNASLNSGSYYLFSNNDPQIYIIIPELSSIQFDKVEIDIAYKSIGNVTKLIFAEKMSKHTYQQTENERINIEYTTQLEKQSRTSEEKIKNELLHIEKIEKLIVTKEKIIQDQSVLLYEKDQLMFNKNEQIIKLEDLITRKSNHISELQNSLADQTKQLTKTTTTIEELKTSIQKLMIENNNLQRIINEKQSTIDLYQEEIKNSKRNKVQLEESISNLTNEIGDKDVEIKTIYQNLNSLRIEIENGYEIQNKLQLDFDQLNDYKKKIENELTIIKLSRSYNLAKITATILNPVALFHLVKKYFHNKEIIQNIAQSSLFDANYYLQNNPDVAKAKMNPAKHYLLHGGFEGRNPSENFDSFFYLHQNPDVKESGINPLLHYVLHGKDEGRTTREEKIEVEKAGEMTSEISDVHTTSLNNSSFEIFREQEDDANEQIRIIKESGFFDEDFYYSEYPDVKASGIDPLEHYCKYGWKEGRNPSASFETLYYVSVYKDVNKSGLNPLFHYAKTGAKEGRQTQFLDCNCTSGNAFENPKPLEIEINNLPVKPIAFYLPQFHPIPENDQWWGKNFTEWTNVTRAKPQFENHYQPHLPLDLGFYDLRIPEVMQQQIEMAKSFGIAGFCFYYYWFNGKRLLEKPLDMFLQHCEWNFDFCICWANENWTRRWDGQEKDILIAQNHSPEDDIAFIEDIVKYINDPRYIKVEGKPLVIIYQPQLFPDMKSTATRWREHLKEHYGCELYLTMVQTFGKFDPNEFGFDAAIEFPPHNVTPDLITDIETNVEFIGTLHDAKSLVNLSKNKLQQVDYELFRGVMLNWDNTPRKGRKSNIFVNNDPRTYKQWIEEAIEDTIIHKTDSSKRLIFLNAWNEWAEGTHLEPDQHFGYAYLNATCRALESSSEVNNKLKIGILIHAFYLDILPELLTYLENIKENFKILLSVPFGKYEEADSILKQNKYYDFIIKEVPNIGFDIAPMFCAFQDEIVEFDLICKIHTKKSTHVSEDFGLGWRQFCMDFLLKDEKQTTKIIKEFNLHKDLGILYSPGFPPIMDWIKKNGANFNQIENILPDSLIPNSYNHLIWPIGSFFWFRPDALKPIFNHHFTLRDFESKDFSLYDENGIARDLTLAHSLERIFCYISRSIGYSTAQISTTIYDDGLKYNQFYKKRGFCPICNKDTVFTSMDGWYRDHCHCGKCNSLPRNRAIINVLNTIDKDWRLKKIHESSPSNHFFAKNVKDYSCSQYYYLEELGTEVNGYRNENLEKLTFQSDEFDYFISLDVLEHVFNPGEAIKEMVRTTKKSGAVIFTVPIHKDLLQSIQRARQLENGKIEYILPENYHGNPVGDGKSLVTWDYGKDFAELIKKWGGNTIEITIFNEVFEDLGIIGEYLDVIVIRKID